MWWPRWTCFGRFARWRTASGWWPASGAPASGCPFSSPCGFGQDTAWPVLLSLQLWQAGSQLHCPVQLGKLASQGLVSAVDPGQLVHITDQFSQRHFLVDTRAAYLVYPHSSPSFLGGPALSGAAGQLIPCWGERQLQLSFDGHVFSWPFLLAALQFPIIGVTSYIISVCWSTQQPTCWMTRLFPFLTSLYVTQVPQSLCM
jgi:hypothetical protein